jgi:hypothetical protein
MMPFLMHQDNVSWRAHMKKWQTDPDNKGKSVAGDDRSPAWTWMGGVYHDGKYVGIPSDNLMTMLREGGARVSTGKGAQTYKRQSQSGLVVNEILWPVVGPKGLVSWPALEGLLAETDFEVHERAASAAGFDLFVKSARVGQSKHVRVRARFPSWSASGTVTVFDDTITSNVLETILTHAGRYCGVGDWRPSSPKSPGPYGTFTATVAEVTE